MNKIRRNHHSDTTFSTCLQNEILSDLRQIGHFQNGRHNVILRIFFKSGLKVHSNQLLLLLIFGCRIHLQQHFGCWSSKLFKFDVESFFYLCFCSRQFITIPVRRADIMDYCDPGYKGQQGQGQ